MRFKRHAKARHCLRGRFLGGHRRFGDPDVRRARPCPRHPPRTRDGNQADQATRRRAAIASDGATAPRGDTGDRAHRRTATVRGLAPQPRATALEQHARDVPRRVGRRPRGAPRSRVRRWRSSLVVDTSGLDGRRQDRERARRRDHARRAASRTATSSPSTRSPTMRARSSRRRASTRITRTEILRQIAQLVPAGSTNMFSGLTLAESQMAAAPASHALRRVVMISDGIANIGPSSPEVLGSLAQNGLRFRAQVTSFGVGNDYDERTLNALSVRTNGRLYHIGEPREMAAHPPQRARAPRCDARERRLGRDRPRARRAGARRRRRPRRAPRRRRSASRSARCTPASTVRRSCACASSIPAAFEGASRSLASVRLRFRDAAEGDLERIQEVVARTQLSSDEDAVAQCGELAHEGDRRDHGCVEDADGRRAAHQRRQLRRRRQGARARAADARGASARRHCAGGEEAPRGRGHQGRGRARRRAGDAVEAEGRRSAPGRSR